MIYRCEKCWSEATQIHMSKQSESVTVEYWKILEKNNCTLEEQCGEAHIIERNTSHCLCRKRSINDQEILC